jgi:hypothetical protein
LATLHVALVPQRRLGATAYLDMRRPTPFFIALFTILTSADPNQSAASDPHKAEEIRRSRS